MKFFTALALALALTACRQESTSTSTQSVTTESTATTATTATTTSTSTETPTATLAPAPAPTGTEPVAGPKLTPVDEASKDASFAAFREKLLTAVRAHDTKAVLAMTDPKVRTSFGDPGGKGELEKNLANAGPWQELESALTHGGSFLGSNDSKSFWAPYIYSAWPEQFDAFTHLAVTSENIPLHKSADAKSEVLATLSYDIVEHSGYDDGPWQKVKTADGRTGYVESKYVESPIGYRAGFMKVNGEWKMNAFVAGD